MAALARGDVAAVAALTLLTLLLAALLARLLLQRARRNAVLLLGPCGVGKTALFIRVRSSAGCACGACAVPRLTPDAALARTSCMTLCTAPR